jgi:N-acetylmuramoyl-L-alanine amidase
MLVLHYTGMKTAQEAIKRLCDEQAQVSAHFVIDEIGQIYNLVEEEYCAWHAGVSYWLGHKNVNNISIGIEIVNPGHEFGYRNFPDIQMQSVLQLSKQLVKKYNITPFNVVAHSDIAPLRKCDPGELFNWQFLANNGVGLFPTKQYLIAKEVKQSIVIPINQLNQFGYEIPENEQDYQKIAIAFQRRFRSENISGIWDYECEAILDELICAT